MMIISVTASTADAARAEANAILGRVPATLRDLQTKSGVPSDSLITNSVVVSPGAATGSTRAQLRAVLATSAVGLALTVLLVAAADRLLRARRATRQREPDEGRGAGIVTRLRGISTRAASPPEARPAPAHARPADRG